MGTTGTKLTNVPVYILLVNSCYWDYESHDYIQGVYLTREAAETAGTRYEMDNDEDHSWHVSKEYIQGVITL